MKLAAVAEYFEEDDEEEDVGAHDASSSRGKLGDKENVLNAQGVVNDNRIGWEQLDLPKVGSFFSFKIFFCHEIMIINIVVCM